MSRPERKEDLYIVMPAYNEGASIRGVVSSWYPLLSMAGYGSRLVVADAGSTDDTHGILLEMKETMPQLEVISAGRKEHGPKLVMLYKYAVSQGADYIFQTDSDGQTDPADFPGFWRARKRYDVLLGSRPVRGDGEGRAFVEKVVCFLLRILFGVKVPDANAPFRLMRRDVLERYIGLLPEDYAVPNIMLTAFFAHFHEKGAFRTVTFRARGAGDTMKIGKVLRIGIRETLGFLRFLPVMMRRR